MNQAVSKKPINKIVSHLIIIVSFSLLFSYQVLNKYIFNPDESLTNEAI